ncbi:MAG: Plug domain-containing protein [Gemmatimonadetes bacterium]|nr:Plug domain-containing protein [Gemmatimonadota bacterium]
MLAAVIVVAPSAHAQSPADTVRRPRPDSARTDSARAAQNLQGVRVETTPAPRVTDETDRRLAMGGHYFSKADIEKTGASMWMDVVRYVPGLSVLTYPVRNGSPMMLRKLSMIGPGGRCTPAIFLNGMSQRLEQFDWDSFVDLNAIERIEVYNSGAVPVQYRPAGSNCGSVLLWTTKR